MQLETRVRNEFGSRCETGVSQNLDSTKFVNPLYWKSILKGNDSVIQKNSEE